MSGRGVLTEMEEFRKVRTCPSGCRLLRDIDVIEDCPRCGGAHPLAEVPQEPTSASPSETIATRAVADAQRQNPRIGVMSEPVVLPPDAKLDAMSALEQRFLTLAQLHSRAGGLLVSFAADQSDAKWVAICEQYSQMGDMLPQLGEVICALRNQENKKR